MHWVIEVLLLISFLLYLLHLYISRNFDYWQKRNVPFIKPRPFVGNMGDILLQKYNMGSFFEKLYNDMDAPFFGIFVFSKPALIVKDLKLMKYILVKDFDHFMDRNTLAAEYDPVTAHMLFIEKGDQWKLMRSKMSPFFSPSKLKTMFGAINNLGVSLRRHIDASPNKSGLNAKELTSKFSVDVIAKCVFGIDAKSLEIENGEFLRIAHKIFDTRPITSFRFLCYFYFHSFARIFKMKLFDADVITFLRRVFWECIELREKNNVKGNDLIDIIVDLRKDKELSEHIKFEGDKVIAQALMFFVAGFETMGSTIAFTLHSLCLNQNIQRKLRENICDIVKKHNGKLTMESIEDMGYLDLVIKETLRKYSSVPVIDRVCTKDYEIPETNITIEKGIITLMPAYGFQKDPKYFDKPEEYIPERFESITEDMFYMPFGHGPRNCIGRRFGLITTKLAIIQILKEFELHSTDETPETLVFSTASFIPQSIHQLKMSFVKTDPLF